MTTRRLHHWAAALVAGAALLMPAASVQAAETPAPKGFTAEVTPGNPGQDEMVTVVSRGWEPGSQLQAVICGEEARGGSQSCYLPGAVTALADPEGVVTHQIDAFAPPKPCPCVVRVSTFTGEARAANIPIAIAGHPVRPLPEIEEGSSDLRVERVSVEGESFLGSLIGWGGSATVTVTVANRGDVAAEVPDLEYGFGRGDVEPDATLSTDLMVPAASTRQIEIDVAVPPLAFGAQNAVVQFADGVGGSRTDELVVFPVGALTVLVALLGGVLLWDLRRTREKRIAAASARQGARRFLDEEGAYPLPEVVYLEEVGAYLVKPVLLKNSRIATKIEGRISVRDLLKLAEGAGEALFPNGEKAATPSGHGGLAFLVRGDRGSRDGTSPRSGSGLRFFVRPERTGDAEGPSSHKGSGPGLNFFVKPERHRDSDGPKGSGPGLNFFVRNDRHRDL